jgi:NTP pyrophosphatase (non-canonical NTP hydrolase)
MNVVDEMEILDQVNDELIRAAKYGEFQSAHEGYAVLLEEVDELKEHVWTRQSLRDVGAMRQEAIQVAAMAIKFVQMLDGGNRR